MLKLNHAVLLQSSKSQICYAFIQHFHSSMVPYHSPNTVRVVCTSPPLTSEQGYSQEETKQGATQLLPENNSKQGEEENKEKINCFTGKLFLKEQNKERSGSGYEASLQCAQSSLTFPHLQQHWASFSQLTQENMTEFLKASFKECIPFLSMASNNNTQNEGALACPRWAVAQLFQDSSGRGESAGFGHSRFAGGGQTWAVKMQF